MFFLNKENYDYSKNNIYLNLSRLLVVILVLFGNFIGELLPKKLENLLKNNIFAKHIIFTFLIYTIQVTENFDKNPLKLMINSFFIYLLFLLYSHQGLFISLLILILLGFEFIFINFIEYYNDNNYLINIFKNINIFINYIILFLLITGFIFYYFKQKKDHTKNWSLIKFIFGKLNK